ncbi:MULTISPECIES: SAM-dependent methyltransferase [Derxia]|uniref:SAM-dependent methyltransferase n=1 Tax=Derxia gummosa DSM 723 TaxID=1121388 RepID=A0A8B6XBN9_9BURK|nr:MULTISPECIES: SAM-dependent methyltransferase [Derxia]
MKSDFQDAHTRHTHDAGLLFEQSRWANADHLYGVAAECGLKALMQAFGMEINPQTDAPAKREDRDHINAIWARFESYRTGHHAGTEYALSSENPFENWTISQRYAGQASFNEAIAATHKSGCNSVAELVKKARTEGLLP